MEGSPLSKTWASRTFDKARVPISEMALSPDPWLEDDPRSKTIQDRVDIEVPEFPLHGAPLRARTPFRQARCARYSRPSSPSDERQHAEELIPRSRPQHEWPS